VTLHRLSRSLVHAFVAATLIACGGGSGTNSVDPAPPPQGGGPTNPTPVDPVPPAPPPPVDPGTALANPLLFATQTPRLADFANRTSTFGNHLATVEAVRRGGDLMIRYPDGTLRNLTREAGFGTASEAQGASSIAVREPSVHWDGTKAVFSMVVGVGSTSVWQLYEVSGLAKGEAVQIRKVANQPPDYNNISPTYATDGRILFTSDRPRNGARHLYPQRDEYESVATVTGIWSLDPTAAGAESLHILNHTPSGAQLPFVDTSCRIIFTRWDHLQRDQQKDIDEGEGTQNYGAFNYADESTSLVRTGNSNEVFPEPRKASRSARFGAVRGFTFNHFTPWMMNQDGSGEETLNHLGRAELSAGFIPPSFTDDPALLDSAPESLRANRLFLREDGGLFHIKEDPAQPGTYFGIAAREFGSLTSNQIVKLAAGPLVNPQDTVISAVTAAIGDASPGGRYRNPLPLADGRLVAVHTPATAAEASLMSEFRIRLLQRNSTTGLYEAGPFLTAGIARTVSGAGVGETVRGNLWELEPVEVRAQRVPTCHQPALEAQEAAVFAEEGVNEATFRTWLKENNLALIVTRNQTSRDAADRQQPFNLRVPGGVSRRGAGSSGRDYDISHLQIFQADQVRGYANGPGRRILYQPLHEAGIPALMTTGPQGSVDIAPDGSTAALVPARRALSWQTVAPDGEPVVRERVGVTFQPGEINVCKSCHGVNKKDQAGFDPPTNKPEALRRLIRMWKELPTVAAVTRGQSTSSPARY